MERRGPFSFFGPAAALAFILVGTVYHAEGTYGFKPFVNLEALLLVLCGTLFCLSVAFPLSEAFRAVIRTSRGLPAGDEDEARRWGEILRHGADSAMGMGGAATLLGMILMLSSLDDISAVPRRMALSLVAMFYGLMLSEAFFAPLARRVRGPDLTLRIPPPGGGQRRMMMAMGSVGSSVLTLFVILYALSAAVAKDLRPPEAVATPAETMRIHFSFIELECEGKPVSGKQAEVAASRLHWARAKDFESEDYARTFSVGEEFILEEREGRGVRCHVGWKRR
ncbi:MAG: hypothetical protein FD126_2247 [Elusimicrobia bacterium]|nr:MAG: hypothetical protein FD126_2247 [Elusimicrobiota bacterium]